MRFNWLIIAGFSLFWLNLGAQTEAENRWVSDIAEAVSENETTLDEDEIDNLLQHLQARPINLNYAQRTDLEQIPLLSDNDIENILYYRYQKGNFKTIYELLSIPGISADKAQLLSRFLAVTDTTQMRISAYPKNESALMWRFPSSFSDSKAVVATRVLFRNKISAGRFSYNLSYEKDAGELFIDTINHMPECIRFSVQYNGRGCIKQVVAGDFKLKLGQGLLAWQGFGMGKSTDVLNIRKRGSTLQQVTSGDGAASMRGIGAHLVTGMFTFAPWLSYAKRDAKVESDSLTGYTFQNETDYSGYHLSESQRLKRGAATEWCYGIRSMVRTENANVAVNVLTIQTNNDVMLNTYPVGLGRIIPKTNTMVSADWFWHPGPTSLWGEVARDGSGHFSGVAGLSARPATRLSMCLVYRHYDALFYTPFALSFGENSDAGNEEGLYAGVDYDISSRLSMSVYADLFSFPAAKYRISAPSTGIDHRIRFDYHLARGTDLILSGRFKQKAEDESVEANAIKQTPQTQKTGVRCEIQSQMSPKFECRTRMEASVFSKSGSTKTGTMVFQDVIFRNLTNTWSVAFRYAAFYSPDYNTRIYAYQPDVLYAFSAPAMFGEGQIVSSNIRWKTNSGLAIYLRTTYGMRDYNAEITPIREANILLRWSFGLSKKYVKPTIPF